MLVLCRRSRRGGPKFTAVPAQESQDEDKEGGDLSTGITFTSRSSKYNCSTTRQGRPSLIYIYSLRSGSAHYYARSPQNITIPSFYYTVLSHSEDQRESLFLFIFSLSSADKMNCVHFIFLLQPSQSVLVAGCMVGITP